MDTFSQGVGETHVNFENNLSKNSSSDEMIKDWIEGVNCSYGTSDYEVFSKLCSILNLLGANEIHLKNGDSLLTSFKDLLDQHCQVIEDQLAFFQHDPWKGDKLPQFDLLISRLSFFEPYEGAKGLATQIQETKQKLIAQASSTPLSGQSVTTTNLDSTAKTDLTIEDLFNVLDELRRIFRSGRDCLALLGRQ